MKVLFVFPSLAGVDYSGDGLDVRGPAGNGDLTRAVLDGAKVIGLVAGVFGSVAAVWHKEILFALSEGVRVLGASSMGALRAAECARFGMEPVGVIAERYLDGSLDDDAAVALLHMPGELGWAPLTEPLVDVDATLGTLLRQTLITDQEARQMSTGAAAIFFKRRTVDAIVGCSTAEESRKATLKVLYEVYRRSQKREDALELLAQLRAAEPADPPETAGWTLSQPPMWQRQVESARQAAGTP
jgi:hypothetical protein